MIVGKLYATGDIRRDAGFSIFYMGINLGAFIAPLICGYLGQQINWHFGFAAAGVGMTLGVIQYVLGGTQPRRRGPAAGAGDARRAGAMAAPGARSAGGVLVALVLIVGVGGYTGAGADLRDAGRRCRRRVPAARDRRLLRLAVSRRASGPPEERKRLYVIGVLFLAASLFWSVFEQAGSTLNLFADRNTYNNVFGFDFPSSWFQSMNSFFLIMFAPVMAWVWVRMAAAGQGAVDADEVRVGPGVRRPRLRDPDAAGARRGQLASPMWLTATYFLHTIGELVLSPVGLSAMTVLAPARIGGLMMGVWFLATSVGNFIGGRVSGLYESLALPSLFGAVAAICHRRRRRS